MKLLISIILFILSMTNIQAKDSTAVLHYLVRAPEVKAAPQPLIILLHGVGSNEKDLFSFAELLPDNYTVIAARAPITLSKGRYAWYQVDFSTGKPVFSFEQEEKSRDIIIDFVEQMKEKYATGNSPVYLCGFSQGAIMSYSVALTRPGLVNGIAIMSGRLLEEIKPLIAAKEKIAGLKIFISHGTNDGTLPVQYAQQARAYLQSQGIDPVYKEYTEGHGINSSMLNDLIKWLQ